MTTKLENIKIEKKFTEELVAEELLAKSKLHNRGVIGCVVEAIFGSLPECSPSSYPLNNLAYWEAMFSTEYNLKLIGIKLESVSATRRVMVKDGKLNIKKIVLKLNELEKLEKKGN